MAERHRLAASKALSVLKRKDPSVSAILTSSPHVVAYELDYKTEPTKWTRLDVEGPLHVVERDAHPHYTLVILNRKGIDYLTDPLVEGQLEIDVADRLMMYRMNGGVLHGIWFYEKSDCQAISELMADINLTGRPRATHSPTSSLDHAPVESAGCGSLERFFPGLARGSLPKTSPNQQVLPNVSSKTSPEPMVLGAENPSEDTNHAGNFIMGLIGAGPISSPPQRQPSPTNNGARTASRAIPVPHNNQTTSLVQQNRVQASPGTARQIILPGAGSASLQANIPAKSPLHQGRAQQKPGTSRVNIQQGKSVSTQADQPIMSPVLQNKMQPRPETARSNLPQEPLALSKGVHEAKSPAQHNRAQPRPDTSRQDPQQVPSVSVVGHRPSKKSSAHQSKVHQKPEAGQNVPQVSIQGVAAGIAGLPWPNNTSKVTRDDFFAVVERASVDKNLLENIYQCYLRSPG